MAISLTAYAKADIRAAKSALEAVKAKEGNEKATKGIAAYHAQQAIEKKALRLAEEWLDEITA